MAGSVGSVVNTVWGDQRVVMGIMDGADGASEAIDTGLESIASISVTPKSCATNGGVEFTISGGSITPVTCDSGDTYHLIAIGK